MLEVEDLHVSYGLSQVLFGVSFAVTAGEAVALLGRNGVGKTTAISVILFALSRRARGGGAEGRGRGG